jgi:putative flippase GtrA
MSAKKPRQKHEITRIIQYLASGGAYFWAGYGMFFALDKGLGLSLWWAKLGANIFGWIVNYVLQRYWVFNNPSLAAKQAQVTTRYVFITLVNFLLDYVIVATLKSAGLTPYIGQFVSSGFFTVWNYVWYRWWVFSDPTRKPRRGV